MPTLPDLVRATGLPYRRLYRAASHGWMPATQPLGLRRWHVPQAWLDTCWAAAHTAPERAAALEAVWMAARTSRPPVTSPVPPTGWLSLARWATAVGVNEATARAWCAAGQIPGIIYGPRNARTGLRSIRLPAATVPWGRALAETQPLG